MSAIDSKWCCDRGSNRLGYHLLYSRATCIPHGFLPWQMLHVLGILNIPESNLGFTLTALCIVLSGVSARNLILLPCLPSLAFLLNVGGSLCDPVTLVWCILAKPVTYMRCQFLLLVWAVAWALGPWLQCPLSAWMAELWKALPYCAGWLYVNSPQTVVIWE